MNNFLIVLLIFSLVCLLAYILNKRQLRKNSLPKEFLESSAPLQEELIIPYPVPETPIAEKKLKRNLTLLNLSNGGSGLSYVVPTDGKNDLIVFGLNANPLLTGQSESFSGVFGKEYSMFITNNTNFDCNLHRFVDSVEQERIPIAKQETLQVFGWEYKEKNIVKLVLKPI